MPGNLSHIVQQSDNALVSTLGLHKLPTESVTALSSSVTATTGSPGSKRSRDMPSGCASFARKGTTRETAFQSSALVFLNEDIGVRKVRLVSRARHEHVRMGWRDSTLFSVAVASHSPPAPHAPGMTEHCRQPQAYRCTRAIGNASLFRLRSVSALTAGVALHDLPPMPTHVRTHAHMPVLGTTAAGTHGGISGDGDSNGDGADEAPPPCRLASVLVLKSARTGSSWVPHHLSGYTTAGDGQIVGRPEALNHLANTGQPVEIQLDYLEGLLNGSVVPAVAHAKFQGLPTMEELCKAARAKAREMHRTQPAFLVLPRAMVVTMSPERRTVIALPNGTVDRAPLLKRPESLRRLADIIVNTHAKLMVLRRRNVVKWAVSFARAQQLAQECGVWNEEPATINCTHRMAGSKTRMSTTLLREQLRVITHKQAFLQTFARQLAAERGVPIHFLTYESLQRDTRGLYDDYEEQPGGWVQQFTKHTSDDLREVIENFDEVQAFLRGTCFEKQLLHTDPSISVPECGFAELDRLATSSIRRLR
eukprot:jgi/Mesvir1/26464/Mv16138-RA.1